MKIVSFFREAAPHTLVLISALIAGPSYFIEKPLPNIFLGLRLIAFLVFIFAVYKLVNRK